VLIKNLQRFKRPAMFNRESFSKGFQLVRDVWFRTDWNSPQASDDRSESGAALVEFTILMPVLFLILFGIIEFGMIIFTQNNMTNAAREGARVAAVKGGTLAQANTAACTWLMGTGQTFTISTMDTCSGPGAATLEVGDVRSQISVSAASASLMNTFFSLTNGGGLTASAWAGTFSSSATMRKEFTCPAAGTTVTCSCNTAASPPTGC
jgi:Flp pilus assembly protein TadG